MGKYEYDAVKLEQTENGGSLILFGAAASEIQRWGGVPQKRLLGEDETVGFQRTLDERRFESLVQFFRNEKNIIQNPLLCATRNPDSGIEFVPSTDATDVQSGKIVIESPELEHLSLKDLLGRVAKDLEYRVPALKGQEVPKEELAKLRQRANMETGDNNADAEMSMDDESDESNQSDESSDSDATDILASDESHILEFWQDVVGRLKLLEELNADDLDTFLGFSKEAMIAHLRPVMVVDGQHRLVGAVEAAERLVNEEFQDEITDRIDQGEDPETVHTELVAREARRLPVSLLITQDPAEHVFQFVVVNQKATPVDKALLGTIVSTSLSNDELERISDRLESAGIQLEESRVATQLARSQESPFFKKVERGLQADERDLLGWSVFLTLTKMFRDLRGAKFFHDDKGTDWAFNWRHNRLGKSGVVSDWEDKGYPNEYDYWRERQGPWYDVFVAFWTAVRDRLSDPDDPQAYNYWGSPRTSNIFNKPSLLTLGTDFFEFLDRGKKTIDTIDEIPKLVDEWLEDVDLNYFNRYWELNNNKKDAPGIRARWSHEWYSYRTDSSPKKRLPNKDQYGKPYRVRA